MTRRQLMPVRIAVQETRLHEKVSRRGLSARRLPAANLRAHLRCACFFDAGVLRFSSSGGMPPPDECSVTDEGAAGKLCAWPRRRTPDIEVYRTDVGNEDEEDDHN
jgi:hypothetical protein